MAGHRQPRTYSTVGNQTTRALHPLEGISAVAVCLCAFFFSRHGAHAILSGSAGPADPE